MKRRSQAADNFTVIEKNGLGLIGLIKKIYKEEGLFRGFYKGTTLNFVKVSQALLLF